MARGKEVDVIIAGGGTGGHLYPGISILKALRSISEGIEVGFVITGKDSERRIMEDFDVKYWQLSSAPIMTGFSLSFIKNIFLNIIAFFKSIKIIIDTDASVYIGMGGYVSGPLLLTAYLFKKKLIIFEQNMIPGITNKLLSIVADIGFVAFPRTRLFCPMEVVGNPIRDNLIKDREEALKHFAFAEDKKTIVVIGGSQGAHSINMAFIDAFKSGWGKNYQFIIQTGSDDYDRVQDIVKKFNIDAVVSDFFDDIGYCYSAGDLYVGRAGGGIFEVLNENLPMILIPYPYSASSHQMMNAKYFREENVAIVIEDEKLSGDRLLFEIDMLLENTKRFEAMKKACIKIAKPDSAQVSAKKILSFMGVK
jgi:UDP-N-acetylglucosamine--N-acetylmuramyl-(pentapeptide) pyrophosphoryl-undecaprenol N-acetylglucosamine transferase